MDEKVMAGETQYTPPNKKRKTSVVPPTAEEITKLKENENLYNSTLFRMQIDELLLQVKPKKADISNVKIWLEKFITHLSMIPGSESVYLLDDHSWLKDKRVKYPLPSLPQDPKGKFQFLKPAAVKCIGSFTHGCCLGPSYSIDIAVFMPNESFQKEDYLNARYYKKRALYLCHLAEYLMSSTALDPNSPPQFCVRSGNPMKPVLLLKPSAQWSSRIKIYVHVLPETECFKLSRFAPMKNNVRQRWWSNNHSKGDDDLVATPHYNANIGLDLVAEVNESFCYKVFDENPNLKEALILLKVWLRQRELYENSEGFNGFLLVVLLSHLFKNRKINPHMSSYQVIRNTWVYLSQTDWLTAGPSLAQNKSEGIAEKEFHSLYDVVFIDVTGFVNLTCNLSKENYLRVKEEAKLALSYIDNSCINSFPALFMTNLPFLHQFDHVISIETKKILEVWDNTEKDEKKVLDLLSDNRRLFTSVVTDLLEKGLGQRVSQIAVENVPPLVWSALCNPPKLSWRSLVIGLKLNPEFALSVIEKGPEANLPEGAEFRKFWSPKSELRRFQDGSVCESVVWNVPDAPLACKRLITQNIVTFLLTSKLKFPSNSYCYVSNQLEEHIADKMLSDEAAFVEELSLEIIKSFDGLVRQIRGITTLPLPVTSVLGISSSLRFSNVFPPTRHEGFCKYVSDKGSLIIKDVLKQDIVSAESIEAVIQLGYSKKWPENIEAIRRIRAAFIIEIGKALSQQFSLKTRHFPDYLLVFKDGYIFKLRVFYPREVSLMKEITNSEGLTAYRDTPQSLKLEKNLLHLPKLSSTLHGLSQDYPGYGSTVCLVKRWLRAQMLDDELFPDIPIELIVAWTFISPEPFSVVIQPQTAFLRVLNVLASTNWCLEPVIVNLNGDLASEDVTEIEQTFRFGRENNSLPGLFIATSYDKTGVVWTRDAPTLPILYHTAKLAKETLLILEKELLHFSCLKKVFRPALDFYDLIIHLNRFKNPRQSQGIDWEKRIKNAPSICEQTGNLGDPVVDFNPVQSYLRELRENYSDFALFFHDPYGGDIIGVLFKPVVNEVKDLKISHLNGRRPVLKGKEEKLIFNREAIVEDFYHLGKHLVKNIEKKVVNNET